MAKYFIVFSDYRIPSVLWLGSLVYRNWEVGWENRPIPLHSLALLLLKVTLVLGLMCFL